MLAGSCSGKMYTKTLYETVKVLSMSPSIARVGEWMHDLLPMDASKAILRNAEAQLASVSSVSKSKLSDMVSEDYNQGRTTNISGIRFSLFEVALYLAASHLRKCFPISVICFSS